MVPVVAQVQALHLAEDAFTQAREQGLAEHQRQHGGGVLQQAAAQGDGQQQPQPVPGHAGVQAAVGQAQHGAAGADIIDRMADQPLLPGQAEVAGNVQGSDQSKAPRHFAVDGQCPKKRVVHVDARSECDAALVGAALCREWGATRPPAPNGFNGG
ncbi:hypothetical protein D3C81_1318680 [compost metagenome]